MSRSGGRPVISTSHLSVAPKPSKGRWQPDESVQLRTGPMGATPTNPSARAHLWREEIHASALDCGDEPTCDTVEEVIALLAKLNLDNVWKRANKEWKTRVSKALTSTMNGCMSEAEAFTVLVFTVEATPSLYAQLSPIMEDRMAASPEMLQIINLLLSALQKLDPHEVETAYRGLRVDGTDGELHDAFEGNAWKIGEEITFQRFSSFSTSDDIAGSFSGPAHMRGILLKVKGGVFRKISDLSAEPGENELMAIPPTSYKVTGRLAMKERKIVIVEAEPVSLLDSPAGMTSPEVTTSEIPIHSSSAVFAATDLQESVTRIGEVDSESSNAEEPRLRDYQERIVRGIVDVGEKKNAIIVLPAGAGKSFIARAVMKRIGTPALFLVPTHDLVKLKAQAIRETFGEEYRVGELSSEHPPLARDVDHHIYVATPEKFMIVFGVTGSPDLAANQHPLSRFRLIVFDKVHEPAGIHFHMMIAENLHAAAAAEIPMPLVLALSDPPTLKRSMNGIATSLCMLMQSLHIANVVLPSADELKSDLAPAIVNAYHDAVSLDQQPTQSIVESLVEATRRVTTTNTQFKEFLDSHCASPNVARELARHSRRIARRLEDDTLPSAVSISFFLPETSSSLSRKQVSASRVAELGLLLDGKSAKAKTPAQFFHERKKVPGPETVIVESTFDNNDHVRVHMSYRIVGLNGKLIAQGDIEASARRRFNEAETTALAGRYGRPNPAGAVARQACFEWIMQQHFSAELRTGDTWAWLMRSPSLSTPTKPSTALLNFRL